MAHPSKATLRDRLATDQPALERLSQEAFDEYDPGARERGPKLAAAPGAFTCVAEVDGKVVGFAVLSSREGQAWLDAIAVAPKHRGCGIGRLLLGRIETEAFRRGARTLGLATADANLAALELFLRSGFRIDQRRSRYYSRGQNAVLMSKQL